MQPSEQQDALIELLARTAQGDQRAFARLYELTAPRLYPLCLRMLGSREWAEDILQEVYVRIWHRASDYSPSRGDVLAWMGCIARYRAIDALRYRKRRPEISPEESPEPATSEAGPLEQTSHAGESARLTACLDELGEPQHRAIRLAFFGGLSHDQVGEHLDRPLGTVKSWIRRGLQALRECLRR